RPCGARARVRDHDLVGDLPGRPGGGGAQTLAPAPPPARQPVVESFRAALRQGRAATSLPERLNVHGRGSRSATSRAGTRYAATAGVTAGPGAASRTPRAPRPPPPRR